jgi:hypothetical protein
MTLTFIRFDRTASKFIAVPKRRLIYEDDFSRSYRLGSAEHGRPRQRIRRQELLRACRSQRILSAIFKRYKLSVRSDAADFSVLRRAFSSDWGTVHRIAGCEITTEEQPAPIARQKEDSDFGGGVRPFATTDLVPPPHHRAGDACSCEGSECTHIARSRT